MSYLRVAAVTAWLLNIIALTAHTLGQITPQFEASVVVDLGSDRGQNYGTLFEVTDDEGQTVAGAGFMAAYNTQPRSDRELLQVFVRPAKASLNWELQRLPAIAGSATGFYPFSLRGEIYVHNRSEKGKSPTNPNVYRWDVKQQQWLGVPTIQPYSEHVAGKVLAVTASAVTYDGRVLLEPQVGARFAEHYFAQGVLFIKEANQQAKPALNRVIACRWLPESDQSLTPEQDWQVDLPIPFEFIYAFGQLNDQVLAVSNNGRVLKFDNGEWTTLRTPPVPAVSFQVYSILTCNERLLLGHYPTGEIYEFANGKLELLSSWPPVLAGVSGASREAQTLAIYGGDLYAGIWPWGELWRYDMQRKQWAFTQRMFEHPLPSDAVTHPYELETQQVDPVANLWGQRISGLQPHGTGMLIATSSKSSGPWDPKFAFLSPKQLSDYGAIYLATLPGNLATAIDWKPQPTKVRVALAGGILSIAQDGRVLAQTQIPDYLLSQFQAAKITWGEGIYGKCAGELSDAHATLQSQSDLNRSNVPNF